MVLNNGKKFGEGFFLPDQKVDVIENQYSAITVTGMKGPQVSVAGSIDIAVGEIFG